MSELINSSDNRAAIRWKLLTGVSALALTAYVSTASMARAEDADHPQIWIELDGQFSQTQNYQEPFPSPFTPATPPPFAVESPASVEKPALASWDETAKITLQPAGSEWVFAARIRYGRSSRKQYLNQITTLPNITPSAIPYYQTGYPAYQTITSRNSEHHAILDFSAGRDFGLGLGVSSSFNLGVRFVQFNASSSALIRSHPTNVAFPYSYHRVNAQFAADRKFNGIGPSISWDASAAIAGNHDSSEIGVDWGVNAALLFGRQSVRGHHQTTNILYRGFYPFSTYRHSASPNRSKRVAVPNLGGYAAMSWRRDNAKVSFGYRADVFFGAIDGGIDERKSENRAFFGPYASISVGIGD